MIGLLILAVLWLLQERYFPASPDLNAPLEAWIVPAIMAGTSLLGLLGGRKGDKRAERQTRENQARLDAAARQEGARATERDRLATESRGTYLDLLGGFNPQDYARETAGAMAEDFGEQASEQETQRRLSTQRRGFLSSPIGAGRQMRDLNSRIARALSGLSMQTAGLEQGRIDRYGDVNRTDVARAESSRDRELDLYAGGRDAGIARENDRANRRYGFLGALAQGAGAYYGAR